jgi:hypothetical protein
VRVRCQTPSNFRDQAPTFRRRFVGAFGSIIDARLARADEALYAAKRAGRNRVEAELPHVDALPAPAASDNTIAWSSCRRPGGATSGRQAA